MTLYEITEDITKESEEAVTIKRSIKKAEPNSREFVRRRS